jgi:hypothetical protein
MPLQFTLHGGAGLLRQLRWQGAVMGARRNGIEAGRRSKMPITTCSSENDTNYATTATPAAGDHTAHTPPPPPSTVSAHQQGMLDKMIEAAAGMLGFVVGARYVDESGASTNQDDA